MAGKTFPAFPVHAQPVISRIWQEAHCTIIFLRTWKKLQYRIKILHPKPNLYAQRGYSTREFQALQMVVLVLFDTVDYPVAPCMLVYFLKTSFKRHLVCKVNIMENNFFLLFSIRFCICICIHLNIHSWQKKVVTHPLKTIKPMWIELLCFHLAEIGMIWTRDCSPTKSDTTLGRHSMQGQVGSSSSETTV